MSRKIYILNLETTTKNCSVSLSSDGQLLAVKELNNGQYSHSEYLNLFIEEVLDIANITFSDICAIAVSQGPGSYTGLRIGVSTAKGLCYALDIPMIAVDTLAVVARQLKVDNGLIIPVLDARRMEVYQSVFDKDYNSLEQTKSVVVSQDVYELYFNKGQTHFVGNATEKMQRVLTHDNAVFHQQTSPSAVEMAGVSYQLFLDQTFVDVAYFEPFYLKDFIALKSVK